MADFDGDGLKDLLVGQFGHGKLRIYRNSGTTTKTQFKDLPGSRLMARMGWFLRGDASVLVPVGGPGNLWSI